MSSDPTTKESSRGVLENFLTKCRAIIYVMKMIPNFKVFLRFFRGYLRVNLLGKDQIRFVEIFVTLACNARCDFCSNGLFTEKEGKVSLEKYLSIIDECAGLNVPAICLIGGEPLLYKHLNKLIERIDSHGILSMISTNGYLLTEEKVRELAKCGLTNITVSLHSIDEQKHDSMVKLEGAYQRIFRAKEYCKEYNINFSLAAVVSHKDFIDGGFDRLVNFAIKRKMFLSINALIPTGYASTKKEDLLTFEDVEKLNRISKKSLYISTHLTNNFFGFGCPAGNAYLGVNATGEIFPCFFIPVSLGNVQEMSLRQAWEKACQSPLFTKKHKMCYAGVSREFICNYLDPIFAFENIPIPIEKHPLYNSDNQLPDLKIADVREAIKYTKQ